MSGGDPVKPLPASAVFALFPVSGGDPAAKVDIYNAYMLFPRERG